MSLTGLEPAQGQTSGIGREMERGEQQGARRGYGGAACTMTCRGSSSLSAVIPTAPTESAGEAVLFPSSNTDAQGGSMKLYAVTLACAATRTPKNMNFKRAQNAWPAPGVRDTHAAPACSPRERGGCGCTHRAQVTSPALVADGGMAGWYYKS